DLARGHCPQPRRSFPVSYRPLARLGAVLEEIRIRGLGVIEDATLELGPGLTVVTGETGAGKTMVVSGLHLLFGGRADSGRVRTGAGRAMGVCRLRLSDGHRVMSRGAASDTHE